MPKPILATSTSKPVTPTEKTNLLGLDQAALVAWCKALGQPAFRARQLLQWIHQKGVTDFTAMHNLSKAFMAELQQCAVVEPPLIVDTQICDDGTTKWQVATSKQGRVEMVLIPHGERHTLCISSQAGCVVNCSFCVTGKQGFSHNLTAAEIVGQLWQVQHKHAELLGGNQAVTNVVFMGMGEPLLNESAVLPATSLMIDDAAYGLSKRKVTISTSGIVPAIDNLCGKTDVALAVSLHAAQDELRTQLVPINKRYPVAALIAACKRYLDSLPTRRFITFEYTLMEGINDQIHHAKALAKLLATLPCKINLIPYNVNDWCDYKRSDDASITAFAQFLQDRKFVVTVRRTRGDSIFAACGQLAGSVQAIGKQSAQAKPATP